MTKNELKQIELSQRIAMTTIEAIHDLGYENVTMEAIAKMSGITKRTLYKYFPVKEAILGKYIQMIFAEKEITRMEAIKAIGSFENQIGAYTTDLMIGVMAEPIIFRHYLKYVMQMMVDYKENKTPPSGMGRPMAIIYQSGIKHGRIDPQLPVEYVMDFFLFNFISITKVYYDNPDAFQMKKVIDLYMQVFFTGVAPKI